MSAIIGSQQDKIEYYKSEAAEMRRKANEYRNIGNDPEAKRLENLAKDAEESAVALENELREIGKRDA
ncbi:hypothetical protein A2V80_01440 [Candidatus Woesebacteria bacterium RBG_16_39_8b]|uniref:Uncharacterized protein n=1 Tax=Candidatus Woesebacteria bacterium RBG_16_39_8b TaxID=1802482 RepID=A0A1F7XII4_9BACT|nr:MAG: hypothetical protein A2V80_01440 [Candidatus Woesebacteria bacterium RBG_16_39_8b]